MENIYDTEGQKFAHIDNIACAPEMNRLYVITDTGDGIGGKAALAVGDRLTQIIDPGEEAVEIDESKVDWNATAENFQPMAVYFGDDVDDATGRSLILPAGGEVAEWIRPLSSSVQYVRFPLQKETMKIQAGAFKDFNRMLSVYVPPYVTEIEPGAFEGCSSLARVALPTSLFKCADYIKQDIGFDCVEWYNTDEPFDRVAGVPHIRPELPSLPGDASWEDIFNDEAPAPLLAAASNESMEDYYKDPAGEAGDGDQKQPG